MKKIFALLLSVAMVASLFVGIAFAAPPTVTFSPINGTVSFDGANNLTITFSQPVRHINDSEILDAHIVDQNMITLKTTAGADVTFTATINAGKTIITIDPTPTLSGEYVLAVVASKFENASGEAVAATSTRFTTAAALLGAGDRFTKFNIGSYVGTVSGNWVIFTVPNSVDIATIGALPTDIAVSTGASHAVPGTLNLNSISGNTYVVTAENTTTRTYTVLVKRDWHFAPVVTGTVGMNNTVLLSGSLTEVGRATLSAERYVLLQHLPTGGSTWGTEITFTLANGSLGQFNSSYKFTKSGSYRLAVVTETGSNRGIISTFTVGSIAAQPLGITYSNEKLVWNNSDQVVIPVRVVRNHDGVEEILTQSQITVSGSYNGNTATVGKADSATAGIINLTVTRPITEQAGTISITIVDSTSSYTGSVTVDTLPRSQFNVFYGLSDLLVGQDVTFTPNVYDRVGATTPTTTVFDYVIITYTGDPLGDDSGVKSVTRASDGTMVNPAAITLSSTGTITATAVAYKNHVKVFEDVQTFEVKGGVTVSAPTFRYGETTKLTVTVLDEKGQPVNNALVTLTAQVSAVDATARNAFVTRNTTTGAFPTWTRGSGASSIVINGMQSIQPHGVTVANGEYTVDVIWADLGVINVDVKIPTVTVSGSTVNVTYPTTLVNQVAVKAIAPKLQYTVTANQTTFVVGHSETVQLTVRSGSSAVTSGLTWGSPVLLDGIEALSLSMAAPASGRIAYTGTINHTSPGSYRVRVTNTLDPTLCGEIVINVVNPLVEILPSTDKITANYYDVVSVALKDPRNNEALPLTMTVSSTKVRTPNYLATINATSGTHEFDSASFTTYIKDTAGEWNLGSAHSNTFTGKSEYEFTILAQSNAVKFGGKTYEGKVRLRVGNSTVATLTLTDATISVTPENLVLGRNNTVKVQVLNAHGQPIGDKHITRTNYVTFDGMGLVKTTDRYSLTEAKEVAVIVKPTSTGILTGKVVVEVAKDVGSTKLTYDIPVVTPPADTAAPEIKVTAPETTKEATANVVVVVTDETNVTGIIFDGAKVDMFPAKSFMFARNVALKVGVNSFIIMATDAEGNVATKIVEITREAVEAPKPAAPVIEVTAPATTIEATATITVTVKGEVNIEGIIFDGAAVAFFPTKSHMFIRTVNLKEGANTFIVSAKDAAGNVVGKTIEIVRNAPPAPPAPVKHVITIGKANPAIGLDVPANVRNGRLMVPFRWFGEQVLGATVDYKVVGSAEIVTLVKGNTSIELTLNSTIAKVNGAPVSLDVAAYATGGRTLVPARFVAETFGYTVDWDAATDNVTFTKK